ncbi:hypothetical protein LPMP_330930 [Leishmania panamensis]|uniref:Tim10-like domain-containing protein n=6 Tax=Viannia TaxID=37616 RepID=A4HLE3_LEIBR|nr:conserved hypothetical protein [Leishmania braziliensis MHOM/BR/75/M2904]XP_010702186.1 hypothetical protein LPMP_330930 [Leishmania panamensis]KAI5686936.1 hypothetical protein MNV84_06969 [Leishmania braziliensis]CCM18544.1 hypothetical protein, conserved [Leishmania guyanensis]AIO01386.1 hypothetical protein LPMP_330930 [Leishmania panamensis]CAJ2479365.1 unnamed protein product [Leishmania braziliensis]CAJ2479745.1 unnamed protein product [Leishmania braziliensis]
MQSPPPPMTPYEENITRSYQYLNGVRMQSAILFSSTTFCIDRCLDTEELYTLMRTTNAPISYRLQKDMEEKKCVQNCSAKWDELFNLTLTETNEAAIRDVQASAIAKMMGAIQQ